MGAGISQKNQGADHLWREKLFTSTTPAAMSDRPTVACQSNACSKNVVTEYGDEKNPEPRLGGLDHLDRQGIQGEGQAVKRGRVAPDQRHRGCEAGVVLAHRR